MRIQKRLEALAWGLGIVGLIAIASVGCSDTGGSGGRVPEAGATGQSGAGGVGAGAAGMVGTGGSSGGMGGVGGAAGQAGDGAGGMGGSGGTGGMGGAGGDAGGAECVPHTGAPVIDPSVLEPCECAGAHCLPAGFLTSEQAGQLADCESGDKCVPDLLLESGGDFLLPSCESIGGAEGRCISNCVPLVASQADRLPQAGCEDGSLCAPCYDPITGEATGACSQGCDSGPEQAPVVFAACCDGRAVCVPDALVAEGERDLLDRGACGEDALCVPRALAADPGGVPATCESLAGAEGRCLSTCLAPIAAQADRLPESTCPADHLCAPCFDPLTGASTGACNVGGDPGPTQEPVTFAGCCGDGAGNSLGLCVPQTLVPQEQRSLLGQDSCEASLLCAPTPLATGSYTPRACEGPGGGEARCLPACLPDIGAQADSLERGSCEQGELCAPCFDPFTGTATGACAIEGDAPSEPPFVFPSCCSDGAEGSLGTCVASALVPSEQQTLLGPDTCSEGQLCAPTSLARGQYEPEVCASWLGAEGRCLPACLPDVAAQAAQLQDPATDDCGQGTLCVPCFDPVSGASTGACELPGDAPSSQTPTLFPTCCPTPSPGGTHRGTCVPARAAGEQAASLPTLTCETATADADSYVCAPNERVETPNRAFPSCTTVFDGPDNCGFNFLCEFARSTAAGYIGDKDGVCVPACVLSEQSTSVTFYGTYTTAQLYGQSTCAAGEDCAPCAYPQGHPNAGAATGLCD